MPRSIGNGEVAAATPGHPSSPSSGGEGPQAPLSGLAPGSDPHGDTAAHLWSRLPGAYRFPERAPSLAEAHAFCERLARSHYENFSVATRFLPARLRPHFYSIYAYCRIADDLGDEVGNPAFSLQLLDDWEQELNTTYLSLVQPPSRDIRRNVEQLQAEPPNRNFAAPRHPVFIALRETIRECDIPRQPFADLLTAFRQDQTVQRYETFADLLSYCRFSANPVGRLVLYACGYHDEYRQQLSDYTCTALQLANFWQDVKVDYAKGRIYLPLEDLRCFGVSENEIAQARATPPFLKLMQFQVARAREWFARGMPLARQVDRKLAIDIELFTRGGQEILNAIERRGFDVLRARPAIPKARKLWLVACAALKASFVRGA
jgi:squalene synthase HpnC